MEGPNSFCCNGHTGNETTPTHRNQKHLQIRESLQHLQGDGSLPSNNLLIIIRMNELQAPVAGKFLGVGTSRIQTRAVKDHLGP